MRPRVIGIVLALLSLFVKGAPQNKAPVFTVEDMQHDFNQLRRILESEHCCLYEYTGKKEFDSIFDRQFKLIDRPCGSTNGHFCALLKYHKIGKFVGTPSGSTYKCNAGKNTEIQLDKTSIILTLGRNTFAAAVKGMDKSKPIMPDYPVRETYQDFLDGKDVYMETALKLVISPGGFNK
jgi:hypothetical protein